MSLSCNEAKQVAEVEMISKTTSTSATCFTMITGYSGELEVFLANKKTQLHLKLRFGVDDTELESVTSTMSTWRSNQLS